MVGQALFKLVCWAQLLIVRSSCVAFWWGAELLSQNQVGHRFRSAHSEAIQGLGLLGVGRAVQVDKMGI